jgi:PAS domain S-box-containing protein
MTKPTRQVSPQLRGKNRLQKRKERERPKSGRHLAHSEPVPLAESSPLLGTLLDFLPDMVFLKDARTLRFLHLNRAGELLVGWSRERHLGRTVHHFYPEEQARLFDAQDREALEGRKLLDIPETPIQTKTGLRWIHTKKVPIMDEAGNPLYLLGISEDVTEQRAARERTLSLERELSQLVSHAHEAIISWDLSGRIVSWNHAAETLYGWTPERAIGRPFLELLPDWERNGWARLEQRLLDNEAFCVHETSRLRDGVEIEVEESVFLVRDPSGQPLRFASIARDLTELARLRRAAELMAAAGPDALEDSPVHSPSMRAALAAADVAARDPAATVLLLGETGTGKGWLARHIHSRSPRAGKPFLEINCASLSPQLAESELFGHERGAFTGAMDQKRGLVEAATGGTLFLDEVGELPLSAQAQLLTFLDSRQFRRVGGLRTMASDVRLLAATNRDLKADSDAGTFRRDLYYRLSILPITLPPLRERREDIGNMARQILNDLARKEEGRRAVIGPEVQVALQNHSWPGNVRELRNTLERGMIMSGSGLIELHHLPAELRSSPAPAQTTLEAVERAHIERILQKHNQNRTFAARALGISRSTLKRKLQSWQRVK